MQTIDYIVVGLYNGSTDDRAVIAAPATCPEDAEDFARTWATDQEHAELTIAAVLDPNGRIVR